MSRRVYQATGWFRWRVTGAAAGGSISAHRATERRGRGPPDDSPKLVAAVVDVETTGTNPESDKIIELGICLFEYDRQSGRIYRVLGSSEWLEDPGSPIPPEITNITGITDEMVAGHPAGADLSCLSVAPGQSGSRPRQRRHTDVWTCHFVPG